MAYTSVFEDISGKPNARTLTVEGFFSNLAVAAASCSLNGAGGLIAGRLDVAARHQWPKSPGAGPFLIFILAVVLKAIFLKMDTAGNIVREVAAGMAGWCGDDVWYGIRNFFRPQFTAGRSYAAGDIVKHDGKVWKAKEAMPFPPQAVPGQDSRWEQIQQAAQGYRVEDLKRYAQAFAADSDRIGAIIDDVCDDLADKAMLQDKDAFKRECRKSLNDAIAQFM